MATYNTAFGSLPGTNEMLGTTNTTGGGRQQTYDPQAQQRKQQQRQAQAQTSQTFAQLQQQGMARPAPQLQQARPVQQYAGSQQANEMRQKLQQQLQSFGNAPSRFDTQAFQQIRGAQAQNLQAEYQGQKKALDEDLARRGLFASSIGGGRMGDLAGQQSRALADLDAQLLQRAADTQAADRGQLLSAGQGLAELAGSQDLQQFEANRVGQATEFEQGLRSAEFGQQQYQQGSDIALRAGQAAQDYEKFSRDQELREAELLGNVGGQNTLAARQQGEQARQFDLEQQLRSQLGLGGLSLQERQQSAQESQFGTTTAEGRRQFDLQQQLQERLGLGNLTLEQQRAAAQQSQFGQSLEEQRAARQQQLGISQQEIGLRAQQLQQEAQLQGRQMDIGEAQNKASNSIERERIVQQGQQFGLNLDETKAARLQQFGLSTQEVGLRAQELQQQAALQGRQMSIQEAQNEAQNGLEKDRIAQQATQFGLNLTEQQAARAQQGGFTAQELALESRKAENQVDQFGRQLSVQERQNQAINALEARKLDEDVSFRSQQLGLNRAELDQKASQFAQDMALRGQQVTNDQAYRQAELGMRTTQIQNEFTRSGQQITVDEARIKAQREIAEADNKAQLARLEAQQTFQGGEAGKERTFQQGETALDRQLRERLGLTEATGQVYNVNPATGKLEAVQGATGQTLEARRLGLTEAGLTGQFGGKLTQDALQNAYARAAQLSQTTGKQYTVNPETGAITQGTDSTLDAQLRQGQLTGQFGGQATLDRLQQNLQQAQIMSQITGQQYTVNSSGALVPATAGTAKTETARQADLDRQLREAFGMSESTGFVYDPKTGQMVRSASGAAQETVQGQIARNQTMLSLAQALSGLSQTQIAQLLGTTPPSGNTPQPNSPRAGDVRTNANGEQEIFDGTSWRRLSGEKLPTE